MRRDVNAGHETRYRIQVRRAGPRDMFIYLPRSPCPSTVRTSAKKARPPVPPRPTRDTTRGAGGGRRALSRSQLSSGTHSTHWHDLLARRADTSDHSTHRRRPSAAPALGLLRGSIHTRTPYPWFTNYQSPSAIGALGERMTQCGLGWCFAQNASGSLGACFSCSSLGAHDSKDGSDTHWGCAEQ